LWVDADEVHFKTRLKTFVEDTMNKNVHAGMASFFHFVKDMKHYQSLDERLILLKNRTFKWTSKVDEYPEFILPKEQVLVNKTNYRYHHYGYTKPQKEVFDNWKQREQILGTKEWYSDKDPNTILDDRKLFEYTDDYPEVIKL
jgi:hypothetical protein